MEVEAYLREALEELQRIGGLLERLVGLVAGGGGVSGTGEAGGAVASELSEESEAPLPTWILDDQRVARIEQAIEQEQRVRGLAYGG